MRLVTFIHHGMTGVGLVDPHTSRIKPLDLHDGRHIPDMLTLIREGLDAITPSVMRPALPLVEVCRRLTSAEMTQINPAMHPLFRDVTDHIRTVQEKVDSLREVLAFAFEASLLVGQSQETAISKKLASWAAILAVPTAFAGIYGMNFADMPELHLKYGYPAVLLVILAICSFLYWRFTKNGWL